MGITIPRPPPMGGEVTITIYIYIYTEVAWQPRATVGIHSKTGSESCGDVVSQAAVSQAVSLVVLWGVDVLMSMC